MRLTEYGDQDYPELILDCSFNNTIVDATGNYTLSGTPTFVDDPEDSLTKVLSIQNATSYLTIPYSQFPCSYYWNKFKLSVDFRLFSNSTPQYPNLIDSNNLGNISNMLGLHMQRDRSIWYFGILPYINGYQNTYCMKVPISSMQINTWFRLTFEYVNDNLYIYV